VSEIEPITTYRGVAHQWLCDAMGHLNSRHYVAMFDDAGMHLLSEIGFCWSDLAEAKTGWVDAKNVIEYKHEVSSGALVSIQSGIHRIGTKSLTLYHEMHSTESGVLHATMEVTLVCFDMMTRKARPISEEFRQNVLPLLCNAAKP
jgi:acyl-CoA thioester hydrolase